jgi:hypothetical protein
MSSSNWPNVERRDAGERLQQGHNFILGSLFPADRSDQKTNYPVHHETKIARSQSGSGVIGKQDTVDIFLRNLERLLFAPVQAQQADQSIEFGRCRCRALLRGLESN